jgi:hypothetical protein
MTIMVFHLHVDMATLALELYILDNDRKGKREYVFRTMSYGHRAPLTENTPG